MVDTTLDDVACRRWTRVGVLGFRMAPRFYTDPLRGRGIVCATIDDARQAGVDSAIHAVMEGREGPAETEAARAAVAALRQEGVDGVVLGCTEIPLLLGEESEAVDLVNPLALLAEAAVRFAMGEAETPGCGSGRV